ncbi:MAG: AsmA family protein [Burkholderiales bacterium]
MPRAAWIILGVAAGLVALLLIGVAIAIATVDPNRFVAPLAARVKAETGRNLTVQGPVDIKLSLEPKVVLPGVSFDNAPWSKTPQMLTAKRIEAQIALLPLLSRRFEVVQFTLVEPAITLETDANGRGNWEFATSAAKTPDTASAAGRSTSATGIANFEIQDGTLSFRDGATGKVTNAAIERMALHARDMQAPVALDFRGTIDDVPVALAGDLGAPDKWLRQQWPWPVALKGEVDGNAVKLRTKIARSGTTTNLDDVDLVYGPVAGNGSIRVINDASRTHYAIDLTVPSLSLADFAGNASSSPAKGATPVPASATHWIIPDTSFSFARLAAVDAEGSVAIGEVKLRDGRRLTRVGTQFTSRDADLDVRFTTAQVFGGSMRGELRVDARRADAPGVHLSLDAEDLDLAALAAAAGIKRAIRGGKVRANVDVNGRGTTPHGVASTMSGTILVASGPASLGRAAGKGDTTLALLAGALDPLQSVDAVTELRCAVFRLPLTAGIAHVDRSIAIETAKITASASGTIDFRDETLDLSVQPQIREGVRIDMSQLASVVRIRGRFDKPTVGIDAAQTAKGLVVLGALGATGGGIAILGRALIAGSGDTSAPCAVASSGHAPRESAPAQRGRATAPDRGLPKDLGNALGKLLGR